MTALYPLEFSYFGGNFIKGALASKCYMLVLCLLVMLKKLLELSEFYVHL